MKSDRKYVYNGTVGQILDLVGLWAKVTAQNVEFDTDAIKKIKETYLELNWLPPSDVSCFILR